ncbi:MAG: prolyl oligopeptidase family serine peptidase, partial [Candidatus Paceibacterales bacterium]
YSSEIFFSPIRLSLLNRGFIFAVAHVRGGGELGQKWYEDGKMMNKKNTFHDFISCCEFLIKEGYAYPGGISAEGASAGGTLMGAIANMKPELFKCILAFVPAVDVLTALFDPEVENSAFHFDEVGNPGIAEQYFYVKSYSPYENITQQNYPNMLLTAGFNDVQVRYWEPAKFVAKLREFNEGPGILLSKTRMDSAHMGSSGKYNQYAEIAYNYAFLLKCYGIEK